MAFGDTAINLDKFSGDQWWILVIVGGEISWGHHVVNPLPHPQYQQKWVGIQQLSDNYPRLMIFGVRYILKTKKLLQIRKETPNQFQTTPNQIWLVVSTPLRNISQLGLLFPYIMENKNVPNHQPEKSTTLW